MLGHSLVTSQTTPQGIPVRCIMLAEAYDIVKEAYISLVLDSKTKSPMFVVSSIGGTDIELIAKSNADQIHYVPIDPATGNLSQKTICRPHLLLSGSDAILPLSLSLFFFLSSSLSLPHTRTLYFKP